MSYLEDYYEVRDHLERTRMDQWEEWMGEDALDFFCSDCATLLPLDLIGRVCLECEEAYEKLWG